MLEAGKQPSYGKRDQLIPDRLGDPRAHLSEVLRLQHPFNSLEALKEQHVQALQEMDSDPGVTNTRRLRTLAEWRALSRSSDLLQVQCDHEALASENAKRLGRKPRMALMEALTSRYSRKDTAVPRLCLLGMPIVGKALVSPFFLHCEVPAAITVAELLATAERRRADTLRRVKFMAEKGGTDQAYAIYQKTLKEVAAGTIAGPFTHDELVVRFGRFYNVIPSFGLHQGSDEAGRPKFRRIDDHTAGHTNLAATRMQKTEMSTVDYLILMLRGMFMEFRSSLVVGTEDMHSAYRPVPLPDSQTAILITAVYEPSTKEAQLFTLYGQPFGAGHAVPNFDRLAEWAAQVCVKGYHLMLDHFFDDFYFVDRSECSKVSMFCIQQTFELFGLTLDPGKSQPPAEVAHVLGVAFNTRSLIEQGILQVEPKPTRRENFALLVERILQSNLLPPSLAASVISKFGFLCNTLFGKVGRFCTGYVRQRQYATGPVQALTPELRLALRLMSHIVNVAPPRRCNLTDQHMPHIELFVCPTALQTWKQTLSNRQLVHFIDNDSAASGLVKGYSPHTDSSAIIGVAASCGIDPYLDRVESKSNLSNEPSRFLFNDMALYKAAQVEPQFTVPTFSTIFSSYGESAAHPPAQSR